MSLQEHSEAWSAAQSPQCLSAITIANCSLSLPLAENRILDFLQKLSLGVGASGLQQASC